MAAEAVAEGPAGGGAPALAALTDALGAARAAVAGLELWSVPTPELRGVLEGLEGVVRAAQAAQVLVVGEVAARGDALVPTTLDPAGRAVLARSRAGDARAELAVALGVHPATAAKRQATAGYLTGHGLPARRITRTGGCGAGLGEGTATARALTDGHISVDAADVVAATVLDLPTHYGPAGRAAVERVLIAHAPEVPLTTLRHHAAGLLARAEHTHPHGADGPGPGDVSEAGQAGEPGREGADLLGRRETRAHRRRELYCSPDLYGTWHVRGRLSPEAGATFMAALEALAAPEPSDARGPDLRTAPQRRADALLALAERALAAPPASAAGLPSDGGARTRLVVTTDLAALTRATTGAGLLADDAPLSAGAVRRLACDAQIIPAVLGTRSEPLDVGRAAYTVTPAQRRALTLRDRGCLTPGCTAGPDRCHAHHIQHWADGGPTDLTNLALVCSHDHRRIHTGTLQVHVLDGRPVITKTGDPPPTTAPPPWRARLDDLVDEWLRVADAVGNTQPAGVPTPLVAPRPDDTPRPATDDHEGHDHEGHDHGGDGHQGHDDRGGGQPAEDGDVGGAGAGPADGSSPGRGP